MKFAEYQEQALKTAKKTALTPSYLEPMIIGEIGELAGKTAKAVRDPEDWDAQTLSDALAKEYGDICWGVAVLAHVWGIEVPDEEVDEQDVCLSLTRPVMDFALLTTRGIADFSDPADTWFTLAASCQRITGHSFDDVLKLNLDKLASRQERGVIGGSGDNR